MNAIRALWLRLKARYPANTEVLNRLGEIGAALEQYEDAVKTVDSALELDPFYLGAYINLANVYFAVEDFDTAEHYLKQASDINPHSATVCQTYGEFLVTRGRVAEAVAMFDTVRAVCLPTFFSSRGFSSFSSVIYLWHWPLLSRAPRIIRNSGSISRECRSKFSCFCGDPGAFAVENANVSFVFFQWACSKDFIRGLWGPCRYPVMLSHSLYALGNYTPRAIFPEMCKINQSSVDLYCKSFGQLVDWRKVNFDLIGLLDFYCPNCFYGGGAKVI